MSYFSECTTKDEIKTLYRDLCKKYHPDVIGGDLVTMQIVNAEYAEAIAAILKTSGKTSEQVTDEMEIEAQFIEKVQSIVNIAGITIELIGRWIWVSGNTYAVRAEIKAAGFKFAPVKKVWYWHADEDSARNRKQYSLEEIRERHGSKPITANYRPMIAA